jgi:hypothetical protein
MIAGRVSTQRSSAAFFSMGSSSRRGAWFDPGQNLLDILIRKVLQTSVRRPARIVFPQYVGYRVRVDVLRLRQQAVSLVGVPDRLLVQAALGEPARLQRLLGRNPRRSLISSHVALHRKRRVRRSRRSARAQTRRSPHRIVRSWSARLRQPAGCTRRCVVRPPPRSHGHRGSCRN